jgi:hypothetical protein
MKLSTLVAALTAAAIGTASGTALAQTASTPPTPKPAAGALPQPNPNAVQRSFRTQTKEEQQSSAQTAPLELGQSGRTRSSN